jgi:hypothetical protein
MQAQPCLPWRSAGVPPFLRQVGSIAWMSQSSNSRSGHSTLPSQAFFSASYPTSYRWPVFGSLAALSERGPH